MQKEPTLTEERVAVIARVDSDVRAEVTELARANDRSISAEIRRALEAHVQAERAPASAQETTYALLELRVSLDDADPNALVLGDSPMEPFGYDAALTRARSAWKKASLDPVGLHAARHTCASVMIAAGVNVKALSAFMGHASITITLDWYGRLLPGSITEATTLLDAFLARTGEQTGEWAANTLHIGDS